MPTASLMNAKVPSMASKFSILVRNVGSGGGHGILQPFEAVKGACLREDGKEERAFWTKQQELERERR